MYDDIDNKMIELAMCKGLACDDISIEENEWEIEKKLEIRRS